MAQVNDANYQPRWRKQLNTYDPFGSSGCTAYATGFAIDYATFGDEAPTGAIIRRLSNEPIPNSSSPGLNLDQVAKVASDRFDVSLLIRRGVPFDDLVHAAGNGAGFILQVSYAPISTSRFAGSRTFKDGHAIFVPPGFDALDPLADGRISGGKRVYRYKGEKYDLNLLHDAAGSLVIGTKNGRPYTVRAKYGPGYAWAALTPSHEVAKPAPPLNADYGENVMFPAWDVTTPNRMSIKAGQPFYRTNSLKGGVVTKASKAASVAYLGYAGNSMRAVIIGTGAPYADTKVRPTVVYVPTSAGDVS